MFCWDQGDCNALWFLSCLSWPWFDVSHDDISLQLHSQRYMLWTIKFKVSGLDETERRGVPQTLCFLYKQEERRHRHEIALKSEISTAVSSLIIMKGYSSGDIMDRREQRASKMTKWKWLRPFWNRLLGVIKWENAIRRCSANKCMVQIFRYLLQVTVLAN